MYCGHLLESPHRGDSDKYSQHMFPGVNMGKKFIIYHTCTCLNSL